MRQEYRVRRVYQQEDRKHRSHDEPASREPLQHAGRDQNDQQRAGQRVVEDRLGVADQALRDLARRVFLKGGNASRGGLVSRRGGASGEFSGEKASRGESIFAQRLAILPETSPQEKLNRK